jgi:hypothetical protein
MDHQTATQLMAVERYLLNELTPELRDQFEEHFFDCQECALDVRTTDEFLRLAKRELEAAPESRTIPTASKKPWYSLFWSPAFALPALAAALFVIAYQNVVVFPRLSNTVAELKTPEILPSISLAGGNSRGGDGISGTVRSGQPFLLSVDIPAQDSFSSYVLSLYAPSGELAWKINVSAEQAKDTLPIQVPAGDVKEGSNILLVQGIPASPSNSSAVDLTRYHFDLHIQK